MYAAVALVEQVVLDVQQAEEGMQQLLSSVAPGLQQQLQQDLQQAVKLFSSTLQVKPPPPWRCPTVTEALALTVALPAFTVARHPLPHRLAASICVAQSRRQGVRRAPDSSV